MVDDIDKAILNELKEDSRLSFAEIGRLVSLSPSAVRDRVLKMEDTGIIRKYSVELNQKLLGNDMEVIILVNVFHGKLVTFFDVIPQIPEIERAYRITGEQNVHLKLILKDQIHLQRIIDRIMPYGDTKTMLILSDVLEYDRK
ncbi:Lrp/AsnC family transcriptional regulator [Kordia jejudonensis]|uniref:Lrp/AsnC family transcriptional regulator n=1 Tax=Kordia jejudonensis TaxID=1348245 RepID=UPI0006299C82|nr:Lrp/AsnC family transcriptional regulator [Kordia jejudonensis]